VLDALGLKARVLAEAGRVEEAIAVLGEMVERFEGDPDPALRKQVTIALANKVTALDDLDREDESAEVFQDMLTQFGEEALTMFDGTASHFANASEPQEREGLASALYGKALALEKLDRRDEALSTLTELIARFEDDENENVQDVVSDARETHEGIVDGEGG
jgi:pentatricopeptide repeat protein